MNVTHLRALFFCNLVLILKLTSESIAQDWLPTGAPSTTWDSVASSADGGKLVAAAQGQFIYTSTNSGVTWTSNSLPPACHYSLASSADGVQLVAAAGCGGGIYVSTNSGLTWTQTSAPLDYWLSISSSADGTGLAAASGPSGLKPGGSIYFSTNSGTTWIPASTPPYQAWESLACSADGTKLIAMAQYGLLYTSTNSGATWMTNSVLGGMGLGSVASSSDGSKLVAAGRGSPIFVSTNFGSTWIAVSAPLTNWFATTCSADGRTIVASTGNVPVPGPIFTSTNAGLTWTQSAVNGDWLAVASSADGGRLFAGGAGQIYTSRTIPTPDLVIAPQRGAVVLSWLVPSINLALQQNPSIESTNWTDVSLSPTLRYSTLEHQVTIPTSADQIFYRLNSR